ncbi:hypothetical protein [Ectobacillus panaciterrae]|uniref:hypothetical protein n=1 Tax=Ectobacillus panaciterrae TaxID=363872 RepID=UPI0003FA94BD|nr:hypothetical protein [Ectobacillus panaciterrae]
MRYVLAAMTFLILFKAISVDPVKAATEPAQKEMHMRIEHHFRQEAEELGLETDGKSLKEVRKEIHVLEEQQRREAIRQAADHYGIEIDGKSVDEVIAAVRTAKKEELQEEALKAGISVDGKTMQEIASELKEKKK